MLKATSDRKVRFYSNQYNSFGLLPGLKNTCPGATSGVGGCLYKGKNKTCACYVDSLMRCYNGVKGVLQHNTRLLKNKTWSAMADQLDDEFTRFEEKELARADPKLFYRVHWSGDVFDNVYASALAYAMSMHPVVHFWMYTRSFGTVPVLLKARNLTLYLSLDPVNVLEGLKTYAKHECKNLKVCYMSEENDFGQYSKNIRLSGCPVDQKLLPLEGGCPTCRKCIKGSAHVWFKTK